MSSDQTMKLISVLAYFAVMIGIGVVAFRRTRNSLDEYMLAGRGLKPWVAALSAGASDMSGWLLMGLPGAIYASGMVEAWIAIGLTIGAWLNWTFVAPRLRAYTEVAGNSITIPSFLEHRLRDSSRALRIVCGLVILVFFTFYVSSGMVAAGVFFESTFGTDYLVGMLVVAVVTIVYTVFGGFLGATLTDVAQGLLMLVALLAVPVVALLAMGGIGPTLDAISALDTADAAAGLDSNRLSLLAGGTFLGIVSAAAWGLGYFGQPHIIVRFMALRSPAEAKVARRYGIGWMVLTVCGAIATALVGIAYFATHPEYQLDNPEAVFLALSEIMFHPLLAGLVLAAVLAAIMSTISSQLVVCSSALVEDLYKMVADRPDRPASLSDRAYVLLGRCGVLAVALVAALLALSPNSSILDLVAFAWAGFGASFGPIVLLSLFWKRLTNWGALAGLVTGAIVTIVWRQTGLGDDLYELIPGFASNLVVAVAVSLATFAPNAEIDVEFDRAVELAGAKPGRVTTSV